MKHIEGHKHFIECRCVLPQFQDSNNIVFHQFVVFSTCDVNDIIDGDIEAEPTIDFHETVVACQNCNLLHRVTNFCKSIIINEDDNSVAVNVDDVKVGMPDDLISVLESYSCDLATYEEAKFAYAAAVHRVILLRKTRVKDNMLVKCLIMNAGGRYTIETKQYQATL